MWHPRATGETAYPIELTLEKMAQSAESAPVTYTPDLTASTTDPTLGAGSSRDGWWYQVGRVVHGAATFRFGTSGTSAGSGTYRISLPVLADLTVMASSFSLGLGSILGPAILRDDSLGAGGANLGVAWLIANDRASIAIQANQVNHSKPFDWSTRDGLSLSFTYIAA